jgi:hypothetical protein
MSVTESGDDGQTKLAKMAAMKELRSFGISVNKKSFILRKIRTN